MSTPLRTNSLQTCRTAETRIIATTDTNMRTQLSALEASLEERLYRRLLEKLTAVVKGQP